MRRVLVISLALVLACRAGEPFRIRVVEKGSGWPVPLVEIRTTHGSSWVSDNSGTIAIDDPELFSGEIFFHVQSHGYSVPRDGFGFQGFRTRPVAGGSMDLEVQREIPARRIGRLTGAGRFAELQKLEPDAQRNSESGVFGCDSVLMTPYRGKLFWLWGDTTLPHYPLGVFDSTAAQTPLRPLAKFEPPLTLAFDPFRKEGSRQPRGVAPIPGPGPTWLTGLTTITHPSGEEKLVATYAKIEPPLSEYESGLCVWDDAGGHFRPHRVIHRRGEPDRPVLRGHPVRWTDPQGEKWILWGDPFPVLRCRDRWEDWENPERWEKVEAPKTLRSPAGESVEPHRGSIAYFPRLRAWATIFTQVHGKPSAFGEIWFATAPGPTGPWSPAVKVLTHRNYTFYNPRIHPELTRPEDPFLVFEGTYTAEFADRAQPTPRYNYNQILYRLDFDEPALRPALPAAGP